MLPKILRLGVTEYFKNPARQNFNKLIDFDTASKTHPGNTSKFLVIVPKRLDKRSTKRNLTKRIIHESIRKHLSFLKSSFFFRIKLKVILKKENKERIDRQISNLFKKTFLIK